MDGKPLSSSSYLYNGFEFRANIVDDPMASIEDVDCLSEDQIRAWQNNEWWFVGVQIDVYYKDILLGTNVGSLWGIEYDGCDDTYINEIAWELIMEAEDEAWALLDELVEKLE
jgi:hypothetical protein